ncbi:hypothetical protein I3F58_03810 [Streptomyces sp. MUM 203J]|uniref:DUF5819 family protein n=1 Tax=Streptomyces sp. MUM 203J TaxID=2791990 RepID=UPI001F038AE4|nr:DUF5819 family protein [Streptomyces sp. MUM 203J]MCH0538699.1 hypothetical protein [Streptomyces sp. MUM 203J]
MESNDERRGGAGGSAPPAEGPGAAAEDSGLAALSLPYKAAAVVVLLGVGLLACVHMGVVFLHVAPANTLSKKHGDTINDWVLPEFEQNWKLFAPNPLQQNIAVQVRADVLVDGERRLTRWIDLSALDGEAIRGNPFPSHVDQNELRRAWDFYVNWHDNDNKATGPRGELAERYLRRIAMLRLAGQDLGGTVERIQLRSATKGIAAPPWSDEKIDTRPYYRELSWWSVTGADLPLGGSGGQDGKAAAR